MTKKTIKRFLSKEKPEKMKEIKIRIIGIGGGGGNIVSELAQRVKKVSFFVANTDLQALKKISGKVKVFPFGQSLTQGLGTGMDYELAETAARGEKERIKKLLQGQDLVILVASLGGGTGSGAFPVFAKISKSLGNLTYGILTLPFDFEGEEKKEITKTALKKIKSKLNAVTIIPNERIFQIIEKNTPLKEALSFLNKNLALSLGSLIETIYQPGLINIDFADLKTILEGWGRFVYLNTIEADSTNQEEEVIKKVLNNPLYPYTARGARGVLFNISGKKEFLLSEVSKISKAISELVNPEAKIIFGLSSQGKNYQDKIKVTLLAAGCSFRITEEKTQPVMVKKKELVKPKKMLTEKLTGKTPEIKKEPKRLLKIKPTEEKSLIQKSEKKARKKKIKVKISEEEVKKPSQTEVENQVEAEKEEPQFFSQAEEKVEVKIRKNALQIKKEAEEVEQEILEKEKFWEIPPFLRKKKLKL